jgi:tetratricopeptide (TPR) repeat protein
LLVFQGRFDESLAQIDLAHADDPLWPQVYNVEIPVAGSARDYNRALRAAQRYLELEPGGSNVRDQLAWTYFSMGRYEDAIKEWREMAGTEQDSWRASLEDEGLKALHQGGVKAYANLRLKAASEDAEHFGNHPNDFSLAEWEAFLGQDDRALTQLEREVAAHDEAAMNFAVNSMFDRLHANPRFQALLSRTGLKLPSITQP